MKKHVLIILLLFLMQVFLFSVTDEAVTVSRLSMDALPFNERRDPVSDSPFNAIDGDIKTAALYSDFTMEFSKPLMMDQIKIINGNAADRNNFKKAKRLRDIEITIYTVAVKTDAKSDVKKNKKKTTPSKKVEKNKDKKNLDKKEKVKKEEIKEENIKEEIKKEESVKTDDKIKFNEIIVYEDQIDIFNYPGESDIRLIPAAGKNIIEIVDSKKDLVKDNSSDNSFDNPSEKKALDNESSDKEKNDTQIKKSLAGDDKPLKIEPDSPVEKISIPELKKIEKKKIEKKKTVKEVKPAVKEKKQAQKKVSKKTLPDIKKKTPVKKTDTKKEYKITTKKDKPDKTVSDKNKIEITEKKEKKEKVLSPVKESKTVKPDSAKKEEEKKSEKTVKDKAAVKPETEIKESKIIPKDEKTKIIEEKPEPEIKVKKMEGVVRIENDADGRVLVYATLKDSPDLQIINLGNKYTVTKISVRTRDDEFYSGSETDRAGITEISFFYNGKKNPVQGIDDLKKTYTEKYSQHLLSSITGKTFFMYENGDAALRVRFRKDGRIEYHDRFKCAKKSDPDCTYRSMPDMWRVNEGRLQMRYNTLWRTWKYELDSQSDMLGDSGEDVSARWMKIYYKSESGFTDKYLDLYKSESTGWTE